MVSASFGPPPPYTRWNAPFYFLGWFALLGIGGFAISTVVRSVYRRRKDPSRARKWSHAAWFALSVALVSLLVYFVIYQFLYLPEYRQYNRA